MSEEKIKSYYERIEKLLNGANKETYGFVPEEIRQLLKLYETLKQENEQLKEQLKATNKGLRKVINKRRKWKDRYYKQKHIIDELEKCLKEIRNECFEIYSSPITKDATREFYYIDVIDKTLNKLQELKGSDSNE